MGYNTIPTNAQGQQILKDMVFETKWSKSPLFKRILANVSKSVLNGDDMRSRIITANGMYPEQAQGGVAVGAGGTLTVSEYAYKKKTQAIPIDMSLEMQLRLDPANNPKDAVTVDRWFSGILDKAYDLLEWQWLGDGSGLVAGGHASTATSNGVVYLLANTPRIVFDKLLQIGTYVVLGTQSNGVVTVGTGSNSVYCQGYIIANDPVAKTITLSLTLGGSAATNIDLAASASNGIWLATPSTVAAQTTIVGPTYILSGVGLDNATADSETSFSCMHGIRRLNAYHDGTDALYGVAGAGNNTFNPVRVAGSSTTGLTPAILQATINDMNADSFTQPLIATSNIIWSDWCDDYRESSYVEAKEGGARNFEPGFRVNGEIVPVHHTGYWDAKGECHGLDLSTFDIIYTPSKYLKAAGIEVPGFGFRFFDPLHPNSAYYAAGNQLIFDGNLVSDGRRHRNFIIDSLQTTLLSTAS